MPERQKLNADRRPLRKDLDDLLHRRGEAFDLFPRVVEGEGGARGGRHAEVLHDGLRAVVAGADGDALPVEDCAHVVRVNVVNDEGQYARLLARVADDADALDGGDSFGRVPQKLLLVREGGVAVERVQVVNRRAESDLRGDGGRAGLELVGDGGVGAALERDGANHRAAAEERVHLLQKLGPAVEDAAPGGREHLVAGDAVEVAAQVLHVNLDMRSALRAVNEDGDAQLVRARRNLLDGVDRAERVRDVADADELRALAEERVELVEQEFARVVHRDDPEARALLLAEHLPGDEVRVVLHLGDDDLVTLSDELAPVAVHDEVDGLGDAAHEDALARLARVQEPSRLLARALVGRGRLLAQVVDAAVYVRVLLAQVFRAALDDDARNLRRGRVVEVDERLAVHRLGENGEVFADALHVPAFRSVSFLRCLLCRDHLFNSRTLASSPLRFQPRA